MFASAFVGAHLLWAPAVRDAVLAAADAGRTDRCVILGAGAGQLTHAIAPRVESVLAVDRSAPALQILRAEIRNAGMSGVETMAIDVARFDMPVFSVDLVVSWFVFHPLTLPEQRTALTRIRRWLRPGGRLVVVDTMLGDRTAGISQHSGGSAAFHVRTATDAGFSRMRCTRIATGTGLLAARR